MPNYLKPIYSKLTILPEIDKYPHEIRLNKAIIQVQARAINDPLHN